MGITSLSLNRINKYLKPNSKMLIIGCQNLYSAENYMEVAHPYFEQLNHTVKSIDILGCNGSDVADLRTDLHFEPIYDMVNDCGSKEHIDGSLYQPLLNIHNACTVNGFMIHENPKTGNWPGHGQHYFTKEFWSALADACIYEVHELTEEPAMGNDVDGWNISCVLRKSADSIWLNEEIFNEIYKKHIKNK